MTALEQFLVALIGELAADLAPVIEHLIAGAAAGKSPVEILAEESVAKILPEKWKTAVLIATQRAKYAPGAVDPKA